MRLVSGMTLLDYGATSLLQASSIGTDLLAMFEAAVGLLLLAGLWTPIAGSLVAVLSLWKIFSHPADLLTYVLLGTLGAALAMIGPGAYSGDARLFGLKRIDFQSPKH